MERRNSNHEQTNPTADKHAAEKLNPLSFLELQASDFKDCPPPRPISYKEQVQMIPNNISITDRLKDFHMEKNGTLKLANKDLKEKQKAVLKKVFTQCAAKLMEGKNVVGISLPVNIFHERSSIERITDLFRFFPHFCNKAAETENEIERVKLLACALVGSCQYQMNQWKPFNPILGETFQGTFEDGTEINMEHTSHHPAISNFYIIGKKWKCYGAFLYNAKIKPNKIILFPETWCTLKFDDGRSLKFSWPAMQMGNFILGTRKMSLVRNIIIRSEEAKVKCVIKINREAIRKMMGLLSTWNYNELYGSLYIYDPIKEQVMIKKKWYDTIYAMDNMSDMETELEKISGNWLEFLKFDDKEYWNAKNVDLSMTQKPVEQCLPSSYRYREDITWLHYNNLDYAGKWKVLLEVQQRKDKKCRVIGEEIRKKKENKDGGNKKKKKGFFSMFSRKKI